MLKRNWVTFEDLRIYMNDNALENSRFKKLLKRNLKIYAWRISKDGESLENYVKNKTRENALEKITRTPILRISETVKFKKVQARKRLKENPENSLEEFQDELEADVHQWHA